MFHVDKSFIATARGAGANERTNEHVRVALTVIALLLFALVTALAGLHIGPAACVVLAVALLVTDIAHR